MAKSYKEKEKTTGPRARNDAYVMMLFVTLVAIITGSVLMYLDFDEYGSKLPAQTQKAYAPPKLGEGGTTGGGAAGGVPGGVAPGGGVPGGVAPGGGDVAPPKGDGKMP